MKLLRAVFWRLMVIAIFASGAVSLALRYGQGLGATTNLNNSNPWGLWVGFNVLCGVGLSAGGFAVTTAYYILHIKKLKPVVRMAVLMAFLGYLSVCMTLVVELGRPWFIWLPVVMWNPHSVMFEVAWCVMLYTTVLTLEFSTIPLEKFGWTRTLKVVRGLIVPLTGAGFLLSTLHQSSLGSLFLIMPTKLHALWYTPLLPVLFFISAIGVGMAMIIFASTMAVRALGSRVEFELQQGIARGMAAFLGVFLVLRFADLIWRGALGAALVFSGPGSTEANMFWLETGLLLAAILLSTLPHTRRDPILLFASSVLAIGGFMTNRVDVAITGLQASAKLPYSPSWMEISITMTIVTLGCVLFVQVARFLPVLPQPRRQAPSVA